MEIYKLRQCPAKWFLPAEDPRGRWKARGGAPSTPHCQVASFGFLVVDTTFVPHSQNRCHHPQLKFCTSQATWPPWPPTVCVPTLWGPFSDGWGASSTVTTLLSRAWGGPFPWILGYREPIFFPLFQPWRCPLPQLLSFQASSNSLCCNAGVVSLYMTRLRLKHSRTDLEAKQRH